jgi:hypothetical protein
VGATLGFVIGLLLTPFRRHLRRIGPWAGLVALIVAWPGHLVVVVRAERHALRLQPCCWDLDRSPARCGGIDGRGGVDGPEPKAGMTPSVADGAAIGHLTR